MCLMSLSTICKNPAVIHSKATVLLLLVHCYCCSDGVWELWFGTGCVMQFFVSCADPDGGRGPGPPEKSRTYRVS